MEHLQKLAPYWAQFEAAVEPYGPRIAALANPELAVDASVTREWPMMRFSQAAAIGLAYVGLVLFGLLFRKAPKGGRTEKESSGGFIAGVQKEPIKLLALVYNVAQVALCSWMVYESARIAIENKMPVVCGSFDAAHPRIAFVLYVFYLSKILDFFDTFFIVVRGKWEQLSVLHVYHHFSIFLVYWVVALVGYDGDVFFTIVANGTIHAIMYTYYLLTLFDIRPSWGKNLTQMQMLQFLLMNGQAIYILAAKCPYPNQLTAFYLVYIISLFALFMNFYMKRWTAGAKKAAGGKAKAH